MIVANKKSSEARRPSKANPIDWGPGCATVKPRPQLPTMRDCPALWDSLRTQPPRKIAFYWQTFTPWRLAAIRSGVPSPRMAAMPPHKSRSYDTSEKVILTGTKGSFHGRISLQSLHEAPVEEEHIHLIMWSSQWNSEV